MQSTLRTLTKYQLLSNETDDITISIHNNNFKSKVRFASTTAALKTLVTQPVSTKSDGVEIDGFLYPNFMKIQKM